MRTHITFIALFVAVAAGCSFSASNSALPASSRPQSKEEKEKAMQRKTAERIIAILDAVEQGKSEPDQFTNEFKKAFAEPITEEDRKLGYSASEWEKYILSLKGTRYYTGSLEQLLAYMPREDSGWNGWGGNVGQEPVPPVRANCVTIVGRGDEARIGWIQSQICHGGIEAREFEANTSHGTLFLDALLDREEARAAANLSPKLRASLAPISSKSDEARGYNQGTLFSKLVDFRGTATGYSISKSKDNILKGNFKTPQGYRAFKLTLDADHRNRLRLVEAIWTE